MSFSSVAFSLGVLFELLSLGIFAALLQAVIKSKDRQQININDFTREVFRVVNSQYTDMKKDSAQNVALTIEQNISAAFTDQSVRDVLGADQGYNFTSSAIYTSITPTPSGGFKEIAENLHASQASNGTITYRYYINGTDLNSGSTLVIPNSNKASSPFSRIIFL